MKTLTSIEEYMDGIKDLCGGVEPTIYRIGGPGETPPIYSLAFQDLPDTGDLTAFTYGLSSIEHPEWRSERPEVAVSVRSKDLAWALAAGEVVLRNRRRAPFSIGNVFRFGSRISDESAMSAFLLFYSTIVEPEDGRIVLLDRTINIVQLYPIYEEEIRIIVELGAAEFFFREDIDLGDVTRRNQGAIS